MIGMNVCMSKIRIKLGFKQIRLRYELKDGLSSH